MRFGLQITFPSIKASNDVLNLFAICDKVSPGCT